MKRYLSVFIISLTFLACSLKQGPSVDIGTNFSIEQTSDSKKLHYKEFIDKIKDYDIVILGEFHDSLEHHLMQLAIIQDLEKQRTFALAFEMLNTDQQSFIDEAKAKKHDIKKEELEKTIKWQDEWYYDDYKDLIEYAFYNDFNMIAANLSQKELDKIYDGIALEPLKGDKSTSNAVKLKIKELINSFHSMSDEASATFVQMQMRKDRSMANALLSLNQPSILITGMFHASKDIGVPLHIKDLNPDKKVVVIALDKEGMSDTSKEADYVFSFDYKEEQEWSKYFF